MLNKMHVEVSVVITTYNYANLLPLSIKSVLDQSYQNYEIIIVNDGSSDNTDEVMHPYLQNKKIKYIKQANLGQAIAKNNGIKHSAGKYIAFLDADDYWYPNKLEKQIQLFESDYKLGVVFSDSKWVDINDCTLKKRKNKPCNGWVTDRLIIDNFIPFSSSIVKKECFEKVGYFDEELTMAIDWDIWLKISKYFMFDFVDQELIAYRVGHPNQMSRKQEERALQSDYVMNRFIENNPGLIPRKVLRKAMAYTYKTRGDYYQDINNIKAIKYSAKSLLLSPFQLIIYLRIIKNIVPVFITNIIRNGVKLLKIY